MSELKVEMEVTRIDIVYKRRRYVIEKRLADGSGMFIYSDQRLIYSTWNQEVNTPEGLQVEEAYSKYKNDERAKLNDPTYWS